MPNIKVAVPHSLTAQEAVHRIQNLVSGIKAKFADKVSDVKEQWSGNNADFSFKAMGFDIAGKVEVDDREVRIESSLPFAATPFKSRIESTIREKAAELLA
jgi:putative polyhydroxyalkanoic acid system protein